jgi:hypothetical protein
LRRGQFCDNGIFLDIFTAFIDISAQYEKLLFIGTLRMPNTIRTTAKTVALAGIMALASCKNTPKQESIALDGQTLTGLVLSTNTLSHLFMSTNTATYKVSFIDDDPTGQLTGNGYVTFDDGEITDRITLESGDIILCGQANGEGFTRDPLTETVAVFIELIDEKPAGTTTSYEALSPCN